ncbi:conjugal transfer protein TraG N-terminal domain-containing protein [Motilimonas eburnea]|uniref:conjugal transfer protein TraG N-terminal domain-containing protein n=1 Tax=Motilimonas eburnea TaxID=1737488 RepID=UPI001E31E510|nr:conjugal transfer protein TraG N-terminal domain-containing protein [Motilimonas eburnea]MCE2571784.1 conjugal transfer protein TraG N-terminal domain-containing protein [Motilimonas eburnea]
MASTVIYSIGNMEFTMAMLNGVARLYENQYTLGIFAASATILALMGGFVMRLAEPEYPAIKNWLFGLILYVVFVNPLYTVDVTVENVRTGEARNVDGLPLLPSYMAMISTSFLYLLIDKYAQAFSDVDGSNPLENLSMDPYRALSSLRHYRPSASGMLGIVGKSMSTYARSCLAPDIQQGGTGAVTFEGIESANPSAVWDRMFTNNELLFATLSVPPGMTYAVPAGSYIASSPVTSTPEYDLVEMSCPAAHYVVAQMLRSNEFNDELELDMKANGLDSAALNSFININVSEYSGAEDAYTLTIAEFTKYFTEQGLEQTSVQYPAIYAQWQAKQSRYSQMTSDRDLFLEMVPGLLSALEGFVFFIVPVMSIMLLFGMYGLKALMSYFMLLVFINTWPLVSMMTNSYLSMAITGRLHTTGTMSNAVNYGNINSTYETIEMYLSVGSVLSTLVPMLTMFLLYRNVHSMLGMANKMAPNTNVNTEFANPRMMSPATDGKFNQGDISATFNHGAGGLLNNSHSGLAASLPALSMSQGFNASASQTRANNQEKLSSMQSQLSNTINSIVSSEAAGQSSMSSGSETAGGRTQTSSADWKQLQAFAKSLGVESAQLIGLAGELGGSAGGQLGGRLGAALSKIGAQFNASGKISMTDIDKEALSRRLEGSLNTSEGSSAALSIIQRAARSDSFTLSGKNTESAAEARSIAQTYSESLKESEAFAKAASTAAGALSSITLDNGRLISDRDMENAIVKADGGLGWAFDGVSKADMSRLTSGLQEKGFLNKNESLEEGLNRQIASIKRNNDLAGYQNGEEAAQTYLFSQLFQGVSSSAGESTSQVQADSRVMATMFGNMSQRIEGMNLQLDTASRAFQAIGGKDGIVNSNIDPDGTVGSKVEEGAAFHNQNAGIISAREGQIGGMAASRIQAAQVFAQQGNTEAHNAYLEGKDTVASAYESQSKHLQQFDSANGGERVQGVSDTQRVFMSSLKDKVDGLVEAPLGWAADKLVKDQIINDMKEQGAISERTAQALLGVGVDKEGGELLSNMSNLAITTNLATNGTYHRSAEAREEMFKLNEQIQNGSFDAVVEAYRNSGLANTPTGQASLKVIEDDLAHYKDQIQSFVSQQNAVQGQVAQNIESMDLSNGFTSKSGEYLSPDELKNRLTELGNTPVEAERFIKGVEQAGTTTYSGAWVPNSRMTEGDRMNFELISQYGGKITEGISDSSGYMGILSSASVVANTLEGRDIHDTPASSQPSQAVNAESSLDNTLAVPQPSQAVNAESSLGNTPSASQPSQAVNTESSLDNTLAVSQSHVKSSEFSDSVLGEQPVGIRTSSETDVSSGKFDHSEGFGVASIFSDGQSYQATKLDAANGSDAVRLNNSGAGEANKLNRSGTDEGTKYQSL